jgi:hypothetical protein
LIPALARPSRPFLRFLLDHSRASELGCCVIIPFTANSSSRIIGGGTGSSSSSDRGSDSGTGTGTGRVDSLFLYHFYLFHRIFLSSPLPFLLCSFLFQLLCTLHLYPLLVHHSLILQTHLIASRTPEIVYRLVGVWPVFEEGLLHIPSIFRLNRVRDE